MKLLSRFESINTGINTLSDQRFLSLEVEEHPDCTPQDFTTLYRLRAVLCVEFKANPAEYSRALQYAEEHLVHIIYKDVLGELATFRHLAMSGERDQLLKAIDHLEASLTKK